MHLHRSLGLKFCSPYLLVHVCLLQSRESFTLLKIRKLSGIHSPQAMPERGCLNKDLGCEAYNQRDQNHTTVACLPGTPRAPKTHLAPDMIRVRMRTPVHVSAHACARKNTHTHTHTQKTPSLV